MNDLAGVEIAEARTSKWIPLAFRADLPCAVERRRQGEGHSRVTWEIEPVGDSCRLTVTPRPAACGRENAQLYWRMADGSRRASRRCVAETGEMLTNGVRQHVQQPRRSDDGLGQPASSAPSCRISPT
jgi:hypothetical protein